MVLVLAFLTILGILATATLRASLMDRERLVQRTREAQAELLAESGRDRARLRLESDPGYPGETWDIPDAGPAGAGRVVIQVDPQADGRRVTVLAEYPAGRSTPLVSRHRLTWTTHPHSSQTIDPVTGRANP
jgi:type II secretory pathway pseudopilin PulG